MQAPSPSRPANVQRGPKTRVWLGAACAAQLICHRLPRRGGKNKIPDISIGQDWIKRTSTVRYPQKPRKRRITKKRNRNKISDTGVPYVPCVALAIQWGLLDDFFDLLASPLSVLPPPSAVLFPLMPAVDSRNWHSLDGFDVRHTCPASLCAAHLRGRAPCTAHARALVSIERG